METGGAREEENLETVFPRSCSLLTGSPSLHPWSGLPLEEGLIVFVLRTQATGLFSEFLLPSLLGT